MDKRIHLVVAAAAHNNGIGSNGGLPWRLKGDMLFFQRVTTLLGVGEGQTAQNVVIMGRRTWESIPLKFRPLPGRVNMVLSRSEEFRRSNPEALVFSSLDDAIAHAKTVTLVAANSHGEIIVIGGASVYAETLARNDCGYVFLTKVTVPEEKKIEFDAFMPDVGTVRDDHGQLVFQRLGASTVLEQVLPPAVVSACCSGPHGLVVEEGGYTYEYQVYSRLQ
ncbi:dihydrofolate reductase-like domain-containing protein, partial [Obelidium mucronatum]